MCAQSLSHVQLLATPWIISHQAPLSMGFSRQEYKSGLPFPPPGVLLDPWIKPRSHLFPALAGDSLPLCHLGSPPNTHISYIHKHTYPHIHSTHTHTHTHFPDGSVVKNPPASGRDVGSIPELGRSPGLGNGNLLQYSCLENPMERGAWWATVHRFAKSRA